MGGSAFGQDKDHHAFRGNGFDAGCDAVQHAVLAGVELAPPGAAVINLADIPLPSVVPADLPVVK